MSADDPEWASTVEQIRDLDDEPRFGLFDVETPDGRYDTKRTDFAAYSRRTQANRRRVRLGVKT